MRASPTEVASYVGSVTAVASSLTLTDIGVIVGILTAFATFGLNFFFMWRKDRREQRESEMRIMEMERHDG
ncbi:MULTISPECIES: HP1 family phage holin [Burkholderia]|uniref:HP1 family phage holin n=1 Tax=Burkholderia TaxID=32008 RepID=UPI000F5EB4F9|nr:HP1 family phage holin [Burkholderia cepacia]RQZ58032.1 holin [Burkholderia cepacia]HEM7889412.1 holin [Burkholderia cepacia]HEM8509849.1 holin [Burkholderia cepacia]